jgi:hypothetical protein
VSEKRSRGLANRKRRKPARECKKRRLRTELKKIRAMFDEQRGPAPRHRLRDWLQPQVDPPWAGREL